MSRFGLLGAGLFLTLATFWWASMVFALATGTGDYKYNAIMGMLSIVGSLQMLTLSRRG